MEGDFGGDIHLGQSEIQSSSNGDALPTMKPHFFSIISDPSIHLQRLRLPTAFRKENQSSLLDHALLRAPEGKVHKVDLTKGGNGHVWFTNGWKEFADCYSLKHGTFLVFRYEGTSRFNVFIFDKNCSEIDYPSFIDTGSEDENENEEVDDDDDYNENEDEEVDDNDDYNEDRERIIRAKHRARAFASRNPWFIVPMHKSYLSTRDFRLWVPAQHAKKYMKREEEGKIFLELAAPEGATPNVVETWMVNYNYPPSRSVRRNTARITTGWRAFAADNDLKFGDTCVFELVDTIAKTYKVHIFRE